MPARVLIADDSTTMRKIILRSLSTAGAATAVEAADGDEAISLFRPGEFDLVLADACLPGKTGLEVAEEIRRQDKNIPIIMVTTEAEQRRGKPAVSSDVSGYLIKPFSPDALRQKLKQLGCPA